MKILIVTTNGITPEFRSWPERLQGRALVANGHSVEAVTYLGKEKWNNSPYALIDGIKVHRLKRRQWLALGLLPPLAWGKRPDVVHVHHHSNQLAFMAMLLCKLRRIPIVFTPHGPFHDPWLVDDRDRPLERPPHYKQIVTTLSQFFRSLVKTFKPKRALKNYLTHAPLKMADRLIALSEHEKGVLQKMGANPAKICVIPNAIDPNWHSGATPEAKPDGQLRVLYMGQLKYRKGFDILAKAMPEVVAKFPQVKFVFAGHSPIHRQELQRLLDEGGVADYAETPEQLSEERKAAMFLGSDLYVLPTRYEGFGIPIIEAMSAGCPVISTDIPVIDEIIESERTGLLFHYNDPAHLAETINRALADASLRQHLADNGRKAAEKYYTDRIVGQIETVYQQLINRAKR